MLDWFYKRFKVLTKEAIHEAEEEIFGELEDELDKMIQPERPSTFASLNIPINILIDGKPPEELTPDEKQKLVGLATNAALRAHVERYLGEQIKELALIPEIDAANLLRGKLYGVSEFYRELLNYEFEAKEGLENEEQEYEEKA